MSGLRQVLEGKREAILRRWLGEVMAAYPEEGRLFFTRQRDRFENPVGHSAREGTRLLFDALVGGGDLEATREPLQAMLRIRAVQEFPASTAVGFILGLKGVLREALKREKSDAALAREMNALEERIDALALVAFDVFVELREELARIRIREVQRHVSWIVDRLNGRTKGPESVPVALE